MVRIPRSDQSGLKKGTWTPEEDRKLVAYVTRYGCWNWRQLPKFAGLARCGKSCRLRWLNYLRPDIKRGDYTQQEEDTIIRLHQKLGNRWSKIATHLPGRTDNEIKNHWHTNLKKQFQVQQKSAKNGKAKLVLKAKDVDVETQFVECKQKQNTDSTTTTTTTTEFESEASQCGSEASNNNNNSQIWDMLSMCSTDSGASSSINENLVVEDYYYEELGFVDALFIEPTTENFWTEPYMVDVSYSYLPNQSFFASVSDPQLWDHHNLYNDILPSFN